MVEKLLCCHFLLLSFSQQLCSKQQHCKRNFEMEKLSNCIILIVLKSVSLSLSLSRWLLTHFSLTLCLIPGLSLHCRYFSQVILGCFFFRMNEQNDRSWYWLTKLLVPFSSYCWRLSYWWQFFLIFINNVILKQTPPTLRKWY